MSFIPLYDQILAIDVTTEQVIDGIILPETSKEDVLFSSVVAVGEGYIKEDGSLRPLRVSKGDLIARGMYSGIPMRLEGIEFLLLKEGECLGKVVKDNA
jgi:chaperonin GroES